MDVQEFFKKNTKWIMLILAVLFFVKTFQSCNRNMEVKKLEKEHTVVVDSLNHIISMDKAAITTQLYNCNERIKDLEHQVELAESERDAANQRANAVQSTAEKIRENTTIKIENNSKSDTVSVDNN